MSFFLHSSPMGARPLGKFALLTSHVPMSGHSVVSADIPACINPPNVGFNALFNVGTDTSELVFLGGSGKLGEAVGVENVHTKLGRKGVSVGILNADVFHKETSPHISSVSLVSHIAFKVDAGSSHNLAGIEHHMAALLPEGYFTPPSTFSNSAIQVPVQPTAMLMPPVLPCSLIKGDAPAQEQPVSFG